MAVRMGSSGSSVQDLALFGHEGLAAEGDEADSRSSFSTESSRGGRPLKAVWTSRRAVATGMQARRNSSSAGGIRAAAVRIRVMPPIIAKITVVVIGLGRSPAAGWDGS
ncbi:hypothetical protein [Streptomyces sp. LUP30]|uniref:hypothetical protein n=1 Tax=Streptomyces sp. LUP30 TaxID=1890285 RepID=UPI00159F0902|nr:hypothetical protein [Streptomyces sp. LUP30]